MRFVKDAFRDRLWRLIDGALCRHYTDPTMSGKRAKRLLCLCGILPLVVSTSVWAGRVNDVRAATLLPVRLCTSLPLSSPGFGQGARGIENSVALATEEWRSRFRAAHLDLLPPLTMDDGTPANRNFDPGQEKLNAKRCVRGNDTLAYVSPMLSAAALVSEPILNQAAMLQINGITTNAYLTNPLGRKSLEPATFAHRLAYPTFYRVVTTDVLVGPSEVAYMQRKQHAQTYVLITDPTGYGTGVGTTARAYADRIGLRLIGAAQLNYGPPSTIARSANAVADVVAAKQPGAVLCGCSFTDLIAAFVHALRRKGYAGPLFGPDSLAPQPGYNYPFTESDANIYSGAPGLYSRGAASAFRSAYRRRFHVPLQYYDALSYDAADIALNAIYQASLAGTLRGTRFQRRQAILPYAAHMRWHGATGITTFDRNGDTRHLTVSLFKAHQGSWLFIGRAPEVAGVSPTD